MSRFELWLADPEGTRIRVLDEWTTLDYARRLHEPGAFSLTLPGSFDVATVDVDYRLEIWREVDGRATLDTETTWLIRSVTQQADGQGKRSVVLAGVSAVDILRRRIVAYPAGVQETSKASKPADSFLYELVYENTIGVRSGSTQTFNPDRSLSGWLEVMHATGAGPTITKEFARRNVLDVAAEVAEATKTLDPPVWFDVVWTGSRYQFRTYLDNRGLDRSFAGGNPVIFSPGFGNLEEPLLRRDHTDELTVVYAGGQGEETARMVASVSDTLRHRGRPFGRIEAWVDATQYATTAGLETEARARLNEGQPRVLVAGRLLDHQQARYGVDWGLGDRVVVEAFGEQRDAWIEAVAVSVAESGQETITPAVREVPS